jgi:hypothetical protein
MMLLLLVLLLSPPITVGPGGSMATTPAACGLAAELASKPQNARVRWSDSGPTLLVHAGEIAILAAKSSNNNMYNDDDDDDDNNNNNNNNNNDNNDRCSQRVEQLLDGVAVVLLLRDVAQ